MGRKLNIAESEFVKEWGMTNQKHGERLQYSVFLLRVRPSMMLDVRMQIEREIDDSIDSVVFCSLGTISQTEEGLDFLGRRGYVDLEIPTVI